MKTPKAVKKLTAKLMADMMYRPWGPLRPDKKVVMERTMKDIPFDAVGFENWDTEYFGLKNGDVVIPAEFHPVDDPVGVVILAHGYGQNRYVLIPQAEIFRELGYSVLMFDQRHFGESKAENGGFGAKEWSDLIALAKWVKNRCGKDTRIVTLGVSMGAMTVMNAIARTDLIDAAIEDCGPSRVSVIYDTFFEITFGFDNPYFPAALRKAADKYDADPAAAVPVESVAKSEAPLLVIHSEGDRTVPVKCADEILAASNNPLSRKVVFGDYDHAFSVKERDTYKAAITDFLSDVFGEGGYRK